MGALLTVILDDLPAWGDAQSPANAHVSAYYLENAYNQTHVPNVVTAVLADYRGFDTMFETGVVFVAARQIGVGHSGDLALHLIEDQDGVHQHPDPIRGIGSSAGMNGDGGFDPLDEFVTPNAIELPKRR